MTTTEQALVGARVLARRAAQRRAGLDANPYPPDGAPIRQACRRAWLRTYLHWRPAETPAVNYGDDVTALAHGPDSGTGADSGTGTGQGTLDPGEG